MIHINLFAQRKDGALENPPVREAYYFFVHFEKEIKQKLLERLIDSYNFALQKFEPRALNACICFTGGGGDIQFNISNCIRVNVN